MKKILVAYDFSPDSEVAVELALTIAKKFGSKVWMLHVIEPDSDFIGYKVGPESVRHDLAVKYKEEHRELQLLADKHRKKHSDITAILLQGSIREAILDQTQKLDASLVVVGAKGRGWFEGIMVGSVSNTIVKDADVPVLVVR